MAEKKDAAPAGKDGAAAPAAKRRNPKLLVLVAVGVLLLAGGGGAAWFFTRGSDAPPAAGADAAKGGDKAKDGKPGEKAEEKKKDLPYFVEFESFTVNMKDPDRYLQAKLTFMVKTTEAAEAVKDLMPVMRSAVIPVLSSKDPAEIMTKEGKDKLADEIVTASNAALAGAGSTQKVDAVLFTHMIIQ